MNLAAATRREFLIVLALWLLVFASSSQTMIIAPILPVVGGELAIEAGLLGTLVSAYSLTVGLAAVLAGPVSDRVGRRRILLMGAGLMTVALLLHGLVVGYGSFLVVRALAGVAGGILSGAAVSYVGDYFPYTRRGWATGWVMTGTAAGQIAGIPVGVVLAGAMGFRVPFYLFGALMGLTFLLMWLRVPQPAGKVSRKPLTLRRFVGEYRGLLAQREIRAAMGSYFLIFLGLSIYAVYLPTWFEQDLGASTNQIALLFLAGGVASVLVGPQAGRLSDRLGRKGMILGSCLGLGALMVATTPVVREPWVGYPFFFMIMALVAMRIGPFSALLTALVPDARRGTLLSFCVALGQVGFAVGAAVAGVLYAHYGYASATLAAATSVVAMGLLVWWRIPEPLGDVEGSEGTPSAEGVDRSSRPG